MKRVIWEFIETGTLVGMLIEDPSTSRFLTYHRLWKKLKGKDWVTLLKVNPQFKNYATRYSIPFDDSLGFGWFALSHEDWGVLLDADPKWKRYLKRFPPPKLKPEWNELFLLAA